MSNEREIRDGGDEVPMRDDLELVRPRERREEGSLVWPILLGVLCTAIFVALLLGLVWFKVNNFP